MLELTTGRNSPLRNVTESIYLGDLSLVETEQLMTRVLGRARLAMSPDISRQLHDWTDGHPYWTQLLAGAVRKPWVNSQKQDWLASSNNFCPPKTRTCLTCSG